MKEEKAIQNAVEKIRLCTDFNPNNAYEVAFRRQELKTREGGNIPFHEFLVFAHCFNIQLFRHFARTGFPQILLEEAKNVDIWKDDFCFQYYKTVIKKDTALARMILDEMHICLTNKLRNKGVQDTPDSSSMGASGAGTPSQKPKRYDTVRDVWDVQK